MNDDYEQWVDERETCPRYWAWCFYLVLFRRQYPVVDAL